MPVHFDPSISRRRFIQFAAGSPVLAGVSGAALAQMLLPKDRLSDPLTWSPQDPSRLIKDPKEAINVFDFEPVMRQNVPPAHFGFMASGVGDEVTLRANREGFRQVPAPAAALGRREQSRHEHRDPGRALSDPDHPLVRSPLTGRSIRKAKSRSPAVRGLAITCRSFRRRPRQASRK